MIWRRFSAISLAGTPPETIACTIALGITLGTFPVYGCPTLLCLAAAALLRPHVPLLQAVNVATSPLQFALALPFHRVGQVLLPTAAGIGGFTSRMIVGWLLTWVPVGICLYWILAMALRRRLASR